ncbi:MAG: hypothetical protein ACYSYL_04055, partial [Planctomycetota bacterium]
MHDRSRNSRGADRPFVWGISTPGGPAAINCSEHERLAPSQNEASVFDFRAAGNLDLIETSGFIVSSGGCEVPPCPWRYAWDRFAGFHCGNRRLIQWLGINSCILNAAEEVVVVTEMAPPEQNCGSRAERIRL